MKAAGILTMIHINSGQTGVGRFMEELGYSLNDLHSVYQWADDQSVRRSHQETKPRRKGAQKIPTKKTMILQMFEWNLMLINLKFTKYIKNNTFRNVVHISTKFC